jgi:transposase
MEMGDKDAYREFFLSPTAPRHRRYEMLRARFVEGCPVKEIAARFTVSPLTVESQIRDFKKGMEKGEPMTFFVDLKPGPKNDRKKPEVREHVVRLRARGYADADIQKALTLGGMSVSVALIDQVLREEGLKGMRKRTREEQERVRVEIESRQIPGLTVPQAALPTIPEVADVRELDLAASSTPPTGATSGSGISTTRSNFPTTRNPAARSPATASDGRLRPCS